MAQRGVVVLAQPGQHALIELAGEILKQPAVGEQILVRHQRLPQRADGGEQLVEQRHRPAVVADLADRSEEHTSELQSLIRISYAVFCLKIKTTITKTLYI